MRDRRGIGRYVRWLIDAWAARRTDRIDLTLLVPHVIPSLAAPDLRRAASEARAPVTHRSNTRGLDLVWFPWNGMTWSTPTPSVVTVHDVWPFVSPSPNASIRRREQGQYRLAVQRAKRFIAVSNSTAAELIEHLSVDAARIDVVPNGVRALTAGDPRPAIVEGAQRYVLSVGEDEPRKDIQTLVEAAALLPESLRSSTAFVIAGKPGGGVSDRIRGRGVRFEVVGEVSDERLASLYAGACAFVFPSRHEGFGLPVLEAMLYGAPVVASDARAVVETAGGAALAFPAGDAHALSGAIERVIDDRELASRLSAAGRTRAAEMTVDRCAELTIEAFRRAVAS